MSKELAFGVIGLGFGAVHARVLGEMEGVRLAAICDSDPQRLATVARGRTVTAYQDYGQMLRDEPLDAVVVAVPIRLHEKVALAVIEAGKALLVEKPLAGSFEEGRRIVDAATQRGVVLTSGHIERFGRGRARVADHGTPPGAVRHAHARRQCGARPGAARHRRDALPAGP
jgi:predicted dehydrogenase